MSLRPAQRTALACLGLFAAVLLAYIRVLGNGFVAYDTPIYLTENPWVAKGLTPGGVRWAFTSAYASNWHPLTWISHMVDVELLGLRPGWHAFENVLWHSANAGLVLVALQRITGAFWRSLLVAALFALHPLHVESVAWIVERKDVLSTFLGLLSVLAWIDWARSGMKGAYLLALLALALSLLAKPMLVTWPFVLLLLDLGPLGLGPLGRRALGIGKLVLEKVPFFLLAALSSVATVHAQASGGAVQSLGNLPLAARLANVPCAYAGYLAKTFWPSGLAFHYPHPVDGYAPARVLAASLLLAAITALAVAFRRRAPWLLLGWIFFLGTLVPVIGLVQVGGQSMADRYTYVPLLGVFVAVAWAAGSVPRAASVPASIGVVAVLGFLSWRQVGFWKDTRTLAEHALAVSPGDSLAHDLLGLDLAQAGRLEEAAVHFRRALELAPGDGEAASRLAEVLSRQGRISEAEIALRKALAIAPGSGALSRRLAIVLEQQGRFAEALLEADRALAADDRDASALHVRAIALEGLGRTEEARADLERSLAIADDSPDTSPDTSIVRMRLARLLMRKGDLDAAEREIARAIAADPSNVEARRGRARLLLLRGRESEAALELEEVLRLDPGRSLALADLAWVRATARDERVRDPARAVELAERATEAPGRDSAGILDALAAAYAASSRFDDAATVAAKAAVAARESGDVELADRIGKRLAAYRRGEIDRETPR